MYSWYLSTLASNFSFSPIWNSKSDSNSFNFSKLVSGNVVFLPPSPSCVVFLPRSAFSSSFALLRLSSNSFILSFNTSPSPPSHNTYIPLSLYTSPLTIILSMSFLSPSFFPRCLSNSFFVVNLITLFNMLKRGISTTFLPFKFSIARVFMLKRGIFTTRGIFATFRFLLWALRSILFQSHTPRCPCIPSSLSPSWNTRAELIKHHETHEKHKVSWGLLNFDLLFLAKIKEKKSV